MALLAYIVANVALFAGFIVTGSGVFAILWLCLTLAWLADPTHGNEL